MFAILAQVATSAPAQAIPTTGPVEPAPWWAQILNNPIFLFVLVGIFLVWSMSRSKNKDQKQKEAMLANMKKGDRVQTIGGVLGTVVEAREDEVLVKVDETSNTKITFTRNAILRVVEDKKKETK